MVFRMFHNAFFYILTNDDALKPYVIVFQQLAYVSQWYVKCP